MKGNEQWCRILKLFVLFVHGAISPEERTELAELIRSTQLNCLQGDDALTSLRVNRDCFCYPELEVPWPEADGSARDLAECREWVEELLVIINGLTIFDPELTEVVCSRRGLERGRT